jgi:hypothetical protein
VSHGTIRNKFSGDDKVHRNVNNILNIFCGLFHNTVNVLDCIASVVTKYKYGVLML